MSSNSFLCYNIDLLKIVCLWPLETKSNLTLTFSILYIMFLSLTFAILSVGQIIEMFVSPDISSMASVVDLMTLTTSALFKMRYMIRYHHLYRDLVIKIDSTFVRSDFTGKTDHMSKWLKHTKFYVNIYVLLVPLVALPLFSGVPYFSFFDSPQSNKTNRQQKVNLFIDYSFNQIHLNESKYSEYNVSCLNDLSTYEVSAGTTFKKRKFIFKCWFPIDLTWSPMYEVVFLWEMLAFLSSAQVYLIGDTFFYMIIYLVCCQLEILKVNLNLFIETVASAAENNWADMYQNIPCKYIVCICYSIRVHMLNLIFFLNHNTRKVIFLVY